MVWNTDRRIMLNSVIRFHAYCQDCTQAYILEHFGDQYNIKKDRNTSLYSGSSYFYAAISSAELLKFSFSERETFDLAITAH